jgi:hypothetical protein
MVGNAHPTSRCARARRVGTAHHLKHPTCSLLKHPTCSLRWCNALGSILIAGKGGEWHSSPHPGIDWQPARNARPSGAPPAQTDAGMRQTRFLSVIHPAPIPSRHMFYRFEGRKPVGAHRARCIGSSEIRDRGCAHRAGDMDFQQPPRPRCSPIPAGARTTGW